MRFFSLKNETKQNKTIKIKIPNIVDKVGYRILLFWISRLFASKGSNSPSIAPDWGLEGLFSQFALN